MAQKKSESLRRLRFASRHRPYTLAFAAILPVPGALAVAYGDAVSAALSNISTGPLSRIMGAALFLGATMALLGIARGTSFLEATGLTIMAAGCVIYGTGVILGLGLAGAVAGSGFIAIGIGTILRVVTLASAAHHANDTNGD